MFRCVKCLKSFNNSIYQMNDALHLLAGVLSQRVMTAVLEGAQDVCPSHVDELGARWRDELARHGGVDLPVLKRPRRDTTIHAHSHAHTHANPYAFTNANANTDADALPLPGLPPPPSVTRTATL